MPKVVHSSATALFERISAARAGADAGEGGKHILIACTPKSGSTFLSNAIANLPDFERVTLTFGFGRREQELCPVSCAAFHEINYVAQHHVRYSQPTQGLLSAFQIFPVILTRNIYDWVVSVRDHLRVGDLDGSMAYIPAGFLEWGAERQQDFIIDFMAPWYANFLACWADYTGSAVRVLYRDLIARPHEVVARIAFQAGVPANAEAVEHAILSTKGQNSLFNVGRTGRGAEQLSKGQISRLQQMFSVYSRIDDIQRVMAL